MAEDNPVNQLVAEEMLEILGCHVTVAEFAKRLEAMGHENSIAGAEQLLHDIELNYDPVATKLRRMAV